MLLTRTATFVIRAFPETISRSSSIRFLSVQVNSQQEDSTKKYRYTVSSENGRLSEKQRDFYEENGYLVIKGLVPDDDIQKYVQRFKDIANGIIKPKPGLMLQKDLAVAKEKQSENTCYKINELYADDVLFEYCAHPNVLDYVECFIGPNVNAIHTMLINKPPDAGNKSSRHPLHQDLYYFPVRPANGIVCAWTAMEKVNRDNGCLVAVPGTHKTEHLMEHVYPEWEFYNKFYYGIKDISMKDKRVHVEMERGDTIFFHPILIHGSGINRTKGFRKAISCHYAASECHFIDVKGTNQEQLANEVIDVVMPKLRMKQNIYDYAKLWKFRAKLLRGKKVNL